MALANALHSKEITTAQVSAVSFGFFSEDEAKKISVKKIVSPIIFDNMKNPIKGGLYDPALGPMEIKERCATCNLTSFECPGHFGHIELAVPLYNPLVFTTLYKLLRCTCLHCFKFRMSGVEAERYRQRLELLAQGKLQKAQSLVLGSGAAAKKAGDQIMDEDPDPTKGKGRQLDEPEPGFGVEGSCKRAMSRMGPRSPAHLTTQTLESMIETIGEFFKKQPTGKCQNCGAHNPTIKREGHTKLFVMPLPSKKYAANVVQGTPILGIFHDANDAFTKQDTLGEEAGSEEEENKDKAATFVDKMNLDYQVDEAEGDDSNRNRNDDVDKLNMPKYLTPTEVQEIMRRLWQTSEPLLAYIYPTDVARRRRRGSKKGMVSAQDIHKGYKDFFVQTILVTPNRFRPINRVGDAVYEHPQNTLLSKLINGNMDLVAASTNQSDGVLNDPQAQLNRTLRQWMSLQNSLNALYDSSSADETHGVPGIRQQLEKKEGLFRKNMMGKRVNFAARSVISPDVYLNGGEIGIPPYFASRLTYPERVTPWNVERLREAVIAGPGRNPGAVAVEDERGRLVMLRKDKRSREAVARTLFASRNTVSQHHSPPGNKMSPLSGSGGGTGSGGAGGITSEQYGGGKIVYRTMVDGDLMLTNRQPTLHKPGMMGHKARIMREERTIRFHYANCSTFNADFDGDEINLHLPQDHLGRTEGYEIVHADHQFFVPTDGKPLRGLIQDHIVAGTLLTMKDRFLSKAEYCQLIYECIAPDCSGAWEVWMEGPAILKPTPLWTGKQVLTAILMHYTRDQLPFTMATNSKVPADTWGSNSGEGMFHVFRNHLVAGCVDKATFGKHGLLHVFYELYGADRTSLLTAALSRLLTGYIQQHGFTCGMSDVTLVNSSEDSRARLLETADVQCSQAIADFVQLEGPRELLDHGLSEQEAFTARERDVRIALSMRFRSNSASTGAALDMKVSSSMHPLSSEVVKACLPHGQAKPFRHNMMALMTVTGAKGSVVNFSQISCLLGQQELEGRRVPRMASGKTLPCFAPFDVGARSGGFVADRFLTGLRPQEYYFHCMAGREGLVDTTVKTSRSGYLQRCLVKNLEALRVAYDGTVRDDCDASIVQFLYGEDGADTTLTGCLRTLPFLFYNMPQFSVQVEAREALAMACGAQGSEQQEEYDEIHLASKKHAKALLKGKSSKTLPLNASFFQSKLGVVPEGLQEAVTDALFGGLMLPPDPDGVEMAYKSHLKRLKKSTRKGDAPSFQALDAMDFQTLMQSKFYRSQAQPGEAVGVIAAQSVGEPSTQMTLNTFHMAGRGEANVTLGIPRLREILMTAAANIKTPVMTIPLRQDLGKEAARQLSVRLKRIYLAEALKGLSVQETVVAKCHGTQYARGRTYAIRLQFYPTDSYPAELGLEFEEIASVFQSSFIPRLQAAVKTEIRKMSGDGKMDVVTSAKVGGDDEFAVLSNEDAAPKQKRKSEKDDEDEYDEENEEFVEGKLRFSGGHGERATYDAGDEEDMRIEKAARQAANLRSGEGTLEDEERPGGPVDADVEMRDVDGEDGSGENPKAILQGKSGQPQRGKQNTNNLIAAGTQIDESNCLCEVMISVPLDAPKLLMREIAERVAARCVLRGVQGISKCYILDTSSKNDNQACIVQTDGINIHGLWESSDIIDASKLTTNSPAAMLDVLGVEAARATVVKEVSAVFGAYGIAVDPRHLSLIADHMTHMGNYRACNRIGIEASTSPFLKMSFETAASFLVSATLHGDIDPLKSPASRIVIGRPVQAGTGSMDLIHKLPPVC